MHVWTQLAFKFSKEEASGSPSDPSSKHLGLLKGPDLGLVLSCRPQRGWGQRSSWLDPQQLQFWASVNQLVSKLGLLAINSSQFCAAYCNLSLSFRPRLWSLGYFWDLTAFFIHREVRFRYRRSITASIMFTLLIRKMLYEDRLVYWICSATGLISDR